MELQRIQDLIRNNDFRSAMDAVVFLSNQISQLQNNIDSIANELNQKVNLVSQLDPGASTVTIIGTGNVATVGSTTLISGTYVQVVNGTDTLFESQIQAGYFIQIGTITATVYAVINDNQLQVICSTSSPIFPTVTNQLYSITLPNTADQLIGNYNFGNPVGGAGQTCSIQIGNGSSLVHNGRISYGNDVVNVSYVKGIVAPINALALQAIKRGTDMVNGTNLTFINGLITYTNTNFLGTLVGSISTPPTLTGEWQYSGNTTNPLDLANVNYVNNKFNIAVSQIYANWNVNLPGSSCSTSPGFIIYTSGFPSLTSLPGVQRSFISNFSNIPNNSDANFNSLFSWVTTPSIGWQYTGTEDIIVSITVGSSNGDNLGTDNAESNTGILLNGQYVSFNPAYVDQGSGSVVCITSTSTALIKLSTNDVIMAGISCSLTSVPTDLSMYIHFVKIM